MNLSSIKRKITISRIWVLQIIMTLGLMEKTEDGIKFNPEDEKKAKRIIESLLKTLGYDEVEWR